MFEVPIQGEIKALGWREGSTGIFTGSLDGLYTGYRLGSAEPDEREYMLELPNGNISLQVQQQIPAHLPLPPRPAEHPFSNGNDPFEHAPMPDAVEFIRPQTGGERPLVMNAMEVRVRVNPEKSTGIFAAASGEMMLTVPNYRVGGYLVINTRMGDVYFNFLEKGTRQILEADLQLDGVRSTGIYHHAEGTMKFTLHLSPPNFAQGPYSGTLYLQQSPQEIG